jgi:2-oxoglutarate ferredoxin oxidoreductase subunit delta
MSNGRLNERGFRYPELSAGCTACQACAQICPDFVFQVWKFDEPTVLPSGPVEMVASRKNPR